MIADVSRTVLIASEHQGERCLMFNVGKGDGKFYPAGFPHLGEVREFVTDSDLKRLNEAGIRLKTIYAPFSMVVKWIKASPPPAPARDAIINRPGEFDHVFLKVNIPDDEWEGAPWLNARPPLPEKAGGGNGA